ncbi:endo-1,4-beta-xylanase B [Fusarium agapanthi]|uniref:Endo-1,4-beta-xylanase B n=1 Tax=Fusarium agapanthi TaxID=1803897 RepID=A0A9P5E7X5_9HYPO|nr:endo-1,4-beta-xylanase B [Fusarium agapanthi]
MSDQIDSPSITMKLDPKQLTAFLAANSTGVGVLVCPGGGYSVMSISYEGFGPAEYLNTLGIDAWVLNYTTASIKAPPLYPTPMDEALAAIELIRNYILYTKRNTEPSYKFTRLTLIL